MKTEGEMDSLSFVRWDEVYLCLLAGKREKCPGEKRQVTRSLSQDDRPMEITEATDKTNGATAEPTDADGAAAVRQATCNPRPRRQRRARQRRWLTRGVWDAVRDHVRYRRKGSSILSMVELTEHVELDYAMSAMLPA